MVLRKLLRFRVFSRGEGERGKVCFTKLQMNGTSNTSLSSIHWGRGKLHIELRKLLRLRVFNRVGGGGVFYHTTKEQNFKNFFDLEYSGERWGRY